MYEYKPRDLLHKITSTNTWHGNFRSDFRPLNKAKGPEMCAPAVACAPNLWNANRICSYYFKMGS
jgi:hypothetical protein